MADEAVLPAHSSARNRGVAGVASQLTQPWIPPPQFNQAGGEVVAGFNLSTTPGPAPWLKMNTSL
jgi:hypothetical protein